MSSLGLKSRLWRDQSTSFSVPADPICCGYIRTYWRINTPQNYWDGKGPVHAALHQNKAFGLWCSVKCVNEVLVNRVPRREGHRRVLPYILERVIAHGCIPSVWLHFSTWQRMSVLESWPENVISLTGDVPKNTLSPRHQRDTLGATPQGRWRGLIPEPRGGLSTLVTGGEINVIN